MTPSPKCFISVNRPPEQTIIYHPFNHLVDLLLPTDLYQTIFTGLHSLPVLSTPLQYQRMSIPLSAILETEFLTKYIKLGNVIMLSRGRIDVDNMFSLSDGILYLSLTKETYEKAGLTGQPAPFGNSRSKKHGRHWVEIDLRDPAMLHGKKGFDRIVWSFENKFKDKIDFLFCDLEQRDSTPEAPCTILASLGCTPRQIHQPEVCTSDPLRVPSFVCPPGSRPQGGGSSPQAEYNREVWRDWATHVYEWLALANLGPAHRIKEKDLVDPYLSTYSVEQEEGEEQEATGVTRLRFRGMIPAPWIHQLWKAVAELTSSSSSSSVGKRKRWFSLTVQGFENSPISWGISAHGSLTGGENGYTLLSIPQEKGKGATVITFEVVGGRDEHS